MNTLRDAVRLEIQHYSHRVRILPIIIINLNNVCDSQCVTCSIWKNNDLLKLHSERHMADALVNELATCLADWHPRQILLSGGEPALHPRFAEAVRRFRTIAENLCVATNGLLLKTYEPDVLQHVREFFISFDGPDAESYLEIRGVDGFNRLEQSLKVLNKLQPRPNLIARCTLQRKNVRRIPELIASARKLEFDAISFLAADISSNAFSRDAHGIQDLAAIQPSSEDLSVMESVIHSIQQADGFIEGGQLRLARILQYFRALCGEAEFPAVRCNAPWVSVVIETTGRTRGCFFHPVIGDFKDMNGVDAIRFRSGLNVSKNAVCQRCVCSKFLTTQEFFRMRS